MFMKLRIIVLLTLEISGYGSTFISLPSHSEEVSVRHFPLNNYEGEFESRSVPFPFELFDHFQKKKLAKTQVAKLNADIAALKRQVAHLMQFQRGADASIQSVVSLNRQVEQLIMQFQRGADESIQGMLKALATINESSSSNSKDVKDLKLQVEQLAQSQRQADESIDNMTRQLKDLPTINGSSSSNRKGKCPPVAAQNGGKVVGIFCYIVSAALINFTQAQNACNVLTGDLAQPLPILGSNHRLYAALKGLFPTEFEKIENVSGDNPKRLWIGYMQEAEDAEGGVLIGLKSGHLTVKIDSTIFDEVEETAVQEGAAITDTGFWTIFPLTTRLPYICRFPLI